MLRFIYPAWFGRLATCLWNIIWRCGFSIKTVPNRYLPVGRMFTHLGFTCFEMVICTSALCSCHPLKRIQTSDYHRHWLTVFIPTVGNNVAVFLCFEQFHCWFGSRYGPVQWIYEHQFQRASIIWKYLRSFKQTCYQSYRSWWYFKKGVTRDHTPFW